MASVLLVNTDLQYQLICFLYLNQKCDFLFKIFVLKARR